MRKSLAESFFDIALLEGSVQPGGVMWKAHVNELALRIWGDDDQLARLEIVEAYGFEMRRRFRRYAGTLDHPLMWWDAGIIVHRAVQLGLVAEACDPTGDRRWKLLSREPMWITVGQGRRRILRQVRGLPPAEQDAQHRREAGLRKRGATLDRKARGGADHRIAILVRDILRNDPLSVIRPHWVREGWVPLWMLGSRLDAAASIVREAHHKAEMDRKTLRAWLRALNLDVRISATRALQRAAEQASLPGKIEIPPDDVAALEAIL